MAILFICGSLRKESYNRKLMSYAVTLIQDRGLVAEEADIASIPLFNQDLAQEPAGWPVPAQRFFDQVKAAEAVVIVSPEYNYSIPGGLKNAIDWGSVGDNAWKDKVVAIMGVSARQTATARGQQHLRQALIGTGPVWVVPQPQVGIGPGDTAFKDDGSLLDEEMTKRLRSLLDNLLSAAKKLS